jgi:exosome complex component RRP4
MLTVQDKDLGKIPYGEFLKISPTRVPRLIGKRGSMIQTIEQATQTRVIIGQNGIVVVTGRDVDGLSLAVKAIKTVEEESHTSNLTQKVKTLLNVHDPEEDQPKNTTVSYNGGSAVSSTPEQAANEPQPQPQQPDPQNQSTSAIRNDKEKSENNLSNSLNDIDQNEKKQELENENA